ncbi:MAG: signal peptidase I [Clostridiales bacterium]|nr:signal peptidase I [Clostridiales bacterium]
MDYTLEIRQALFGAAVPQKPQSKAVAAEKASGNPSLLKDLLFLLLKIGAIALAFVLLFTFLFGLARYQEPSMAPAIYDGDLAIFFRSTNNGYLPRDAVALKKNGQLQVRRVVATAGDTVDITEDGLVINGALQQEPDIYEDTQRYEEGVDFPLIVPEGMIFVLADSRIGATDSRIYGCVRIDDTLGKVIAVLRRRNV